MSWFAEYDTSTGALHAEGHGGGPAQPAEGRSVRTYDGGRPVGSWDPIAHDYDGVPVGPLMLSARDFLRLFTAQERIAIRTSADQGVQDFIFLLEVEPMVNLRSPDVAAGLAYFVSLGLITEARAQEIGDA